MGDRNWLQSLNNPLFEELSIEDLDRRTQVELLEERIEMGCWIHCDICLCVDN